jgi:hypothetical protein
MNLEPFDTSAQARSVQEAAHARLGPEGRLRIAFQLSESIRELRLAGLRSSAPDASEAELVLQFISEIHGLQPEGTP